VTTTTTTGTDTPLCGAEDGAEASWVFTARRGTQVLRFGLCTAHRQEYPVERGTQCAAQACTRRATAVAAINTALRGRPVTLPVCQTCQSWLAHDRNIQLTPIGALGK